MIDRLLRRFTEKEVPSPPNHALQAPQTVSPSEARILAKVQALIRKDNEVTAKHERGVAEYQASFDAFITILDPKFRGLYRNLMKETSLHKILPYVISALKLNKPELFVMYQYFPLNVDTNDTSQAKKIIVDASLLNGSTDSGPLKSELSKEFRSYNGVILPDYGTHIDPDSITLTSLCLRWDYHYYQGVEYQYPATDAYKYLPIVFKREGEEIQMLIGKTGVFPRSEWKNADPVETALIIGVRGAQLKESDEWRYPS